MTKFQATQALDKFYTAGFIAQDVYKAKMERLEQIESNRNFHPATKMNRYQAVVEMARHGL